MFLFRRAAFGAVAGLAIMCVWFLTTGRDAPRAERFFVACGGVAGAGIGLAVRHRRDGLRIAFSALLAPGLAAWVVATATAPTWQELWVRFIALPLWVVVGTAGSGHALLCAALVAGAQPWLERSVSPR